MDIITWYIIAELLLSLHITISNLLVLFVYVRKRGVRTVTNTYIFSLALTDFLAGVFGIPATVYSVVSRLPSSFYGCLLIHLILCILCTISTFHMLAIAIDKYITICREKHIFRSRRKRAFILLSLSWITGTGIAILPLFNVFQFANTQANFRGECHFMVVVDYRYLVYVIFFGTILLPTVVIVFCYISIHSRIRKEETQVQCLLGHSERKRRINGRKKLIRILLILVLTYGICWYPLYIMNTMVFFFPPRLHPAPSAILFAVVLSHLSCALNPIIYAFGMPGFKKGLRQVFGVWGADAHMNGANLRNYGCGGTQLSCSRSVLPTLSFKTTRPTLMEDFENMRKLTAPALLQKGSFKMCDLKRRDTLLV